VAYPCLSHFETHRCSCDHLLSRRRRLRDNDTRRGRLRRRRRSGRCRCLRRVRSSRSRCVIRERDSRRRHTHTSQAKSLVLQSAADDAQWLPNKTGHHESRRFRCRCDQQADLRCQNLWRICSRTLCQHLVCRYSLRFHLSHRSHIQPASPNVQLRRVLALSGNIRNRDSRRPQALRHAHLPSSPHFCARQWQLRHDFSFWNLRAVVLPFDRNLQAKSGDGSFRLGRRKPNERRHFHLLPVNRKSHRRQRRDHRDNHQNQREHRKSDRRFHLWGSINEWLD
jgi:hypothetical protein